MCFMEMVGHSESINCFGQCQSRLPFVNRIKPPDQPSTLCRAEAPLEPDAVNIRIPMRTRP